MLLSVLLLTFPRIYETIYHKKQANTEQGGTRSIVGAATFCSYKSRTQKYCGKLLPAGKLRCPDTMNNHLISKEVFALMELIFTILFAYLFFRGICLLFKAAWSLMKFFAILLLIASLPSLVACFVFASGIVLALPLLLVGTAFGMLKCCL